MVIFFAMVFLCRSAGGNDAFFLDRIGKTRIPMPQHEVRLASMISPVQNRERLDRNITRTYDRVSRPSTTWGSTRMTARFWGTAMLILRHIGAVLAGIVIVVALSVITDMALQATIFPELAHKNAPDTLLLIATAYRTVYGILGGYVTAKLAPNVPMLDATVLGVIGTAAALAGALTMQGESAAWYPWTLVVLALPQTLLGGYLAKR
jgi:hypothetical protein